MLLLIIKWLKAEKRNTTYGIRFIFYANEDYRLQSDRIFYIVLIEKYLQENYMEN
jgi:hypothetical protein